jgi:hypothetical protein
MGVKLTEKLGLHHPKPIQPRPMRPINQEVAVGHPRDVHYA